jgi:hypothetical protein
MWFISFVLGAATSITLGVYSWAFYLERAAVTAAEVRQREWLASMPMPPPRPHIPTPRKVREEVEVVREPKPVWNANNTRWNARHAKPRRGQPKYANPKRNRVWETW